MCGLRPDRRKDKRMNMSRLNRNPRGFTLIELLVVITIIGLLAAIIIPAISGAMKSAKRARAVKQVEALDGAIKRYFAEYRRMPLDGPMGPPDVHFGGGSGMDAEQAEVVAILAGFNTNRNPRALTFLDVDPSAFGVKNLRGDGVDSVQGLLDGGEPYRDPWGYPYGILLDMDFDDKIEGSGFAAIRAKAGVYSVGENNVPDDPPYKTW
jgi:prepilin-type N-terminal cleavage/methylation domain-containing protein